MVHARTHLGAGCLKAPQPFPMRVSQRASRTGDVGRSAAISPSSRLAGGEPHRLPGPGRHRRRCPFTELGRNSIRSLLRRLDPARNRGNRRASLAISSSVLPLRRVASCLVEAAGESEGRSGRAGVRDRGLYRPRAARVRCSNLPARSGALMSENGMPRRTHLRLQRACKLSARPRPRPRACGVRALHLAAAGCAMEKVEQTPSPAPRIDRPCAPASCGWIWLPKTPCAGRNGRHC